MLEKRVVPVELRWVDSGDLQHPKPRIEGRAIVFDEWSADLGFREVIRPGSVRFIEDPLALFDHDTSMVLGRVSAGTLELDVRGDGVYFVAYPPDTSWANDLRVSMQRGDIKHCSFMFQIVPTEDGKRGDHWLEDDEDGTMRREVLSMLVHETSVVSMPAYPTTCAEARALADLLAEGKRASDSDDAGRESDKGDKVPNSRYLSLKQL